MSDEETQILINEELTAYLDGELSGEELATVEQRLKEDPSYLVQMQKLQQSWDLLDVLPRTQGYDEFVKTTMEMAAVDSDRDFKKKSWLGKGLLTKLAMFLLLPGAVFASGYAVTNQQITAPYRQLIRELPLIENHDRYSKMNFEIDFLKQLDEAALFTQEGALSFPMDPSVLMPDLDEKSEDSLSTETINDRRLRLADMRPEQIEALKRSQEKFEQLPADRKQATADFHQQLLDQENKNQLARTMVAYYDWLKSLGPTERTEVLDEFDVDKRIEMIAEKIGQQNLTKFGKAGAPMLPAYDAEPFFKWYERFLKAKKPRIQNEVTALFVDVNRKQSGGQDPPAGRVRRFQRSSLSEKIGFILQWGPEVMEGLIGENDVDHLRKELSLDANEILDGHESQELQRSLIISWMDAANQAKFNIDPARLREFYEGMAKTRRDELDNLSPSDWKAELKELYRKKRLKLK
jgi:hypothetical protein